MPTFVLRLKVLVAEYGPTLVALFVAVAALSATAGGWVAVNPTTTTTTQPTNVQTVATDVGHEAVVTGDGSVWARGTVLENRSTYFLDTSPKLALRANASVPANRSVTVTRRLSLVVTASRDGQVFYEETEVLAEETTTVTDGTATTAATVDVPAVRERLRALGGKFGPVADLSVQVRQSVSYDTGDYADELTAGAPLVFEGDAYWVGGDLSASRQHSETRTRTIRHHNWGSALSLFGLAALAGLAAGAVRVYSRRDLDREALARELEVRKMDEWISDGDVPVWVGEQHVRLDSLVDVVDIGIDSEKRVVHDDRRDLYAVIDGDVVYYYSDGGRWHEDPWPPSDDGDAPDGGPPEQDPPEGAFGFGSLDAPGDGEK